MDWIDDKPSGESETPSRPASWEGVSDSKKERTLAFRTVPHCARPTVPPSVRKKMLREVTMATRSLGCEYCAWMESGPKVAPTPTPVMAMKPSSSPLLFWFMAIETRPSAIGITMLPNMIGYLGWERFS